MDTPPPPERAATALVLRRALRNVCPACGLGAIFVHGYESRTRCGTCGWYFERGPGHWIGGSEINMSVTFAVATALFMVVAVVWGISWVTLTLAGVFTVVFAFAIHRSCRSMFFALDYLIDPRHDASHEEGDDDDGGLPPDDPTPPTLGSGGLVPPTHRRDAQRLGDG